MQNSDKTLEEYNFRDVEFAKKLYADIAHRERCKKMIDSANMIFMRGSVVYGTVTHNTKDIDMVAIVDNFNEDYIYENGTNGIIRFVDGKFDYQIMTSTKFRDLLNMHDVMAIEALVTPDCFVIRGNMELYREYFKLDKWKLRQSFCKVASNSWVKCHKKLTVEKDYDPYIAKKSMFHALRILILGRRIAEEYEYVPVPLRDSRTDELFRDVMDCEPDWEIMQAKFRGIYNSLHSDLVSLCPKPEERAVEAKTQWDDATKIIIHINPDAESFLERFKSIIDFDRLNKDIREDLKQFKYKLNNPENRKKIEEHLQIIFNKLYDGYYNLNN